jgi:AcrR family transcriptional regulator
LSDYSLLYRPSFAPVENRDRGLLHALQEGQMTDKTKSPRRVRQIVARRIQILDVAATLFAERGFHRTTTRDIAEAAEIAEGTLYNYFDSKEDLLLGIMDRLRQGVQLDTRLPGAVSQDARSFLAEMFILRKAFVDQFDDMLQTVTSEILVNPQLREHYWTDFTRPFLTQMEEHLEHRRGLGQLDMPSSRYTGRIIVGLLMGLYLLHVVGDPVVRNDWDGLSAAMVDMLFTGIAPHPAAESPTDP